MQCALDLEKSLWGENTAAFFLATDCQELRYHARDEYKEKIVFDKFRPTHSDFTDSSKNVLESWTEFFMLSMSDVTRVFFSSFFLIQKKKLRKIYEKFRHTGYPLMDIRFRVELRT